MMIVLRQLESLLNYDFCPQANRWVYWMKNPIWILGLTMIAAGMCAYWVSPAVWILFGLLVTVILGGIFWPWFSLRGLECELRFLKQRVVEGEPVPVALVLRNRAPWPILGLVLEKGLSQTGSQSDSMALSWMPGWSTREFLWEYIPQQRGAYPQGTPCLETSFPFGLTTSEKTVSQFNRLVVWPESVDLPALPDAVEIRICDEQLSDRVVGDFGDMLATRLFRPGDSLRRVHWAQTARQQTMIVTEHQAPIISAIRVIPDLDGRHHRITPGFNSLETVIRLVASLCRSLHRQNCYVECVIGESLIRIGRDGAGVRQVLDALALVRPAGLAECTLPHLDCRHARTPGSADMLQLVVLTDDAFHHHPGLRHHQSHQRFLMVMTGDEEDSLCHCRPWITVSDWWESKDEIPDRWRRACHA